jgi:hypothetical protein
VYAKALAPAGSSVNMELLTDASQPRAIHAAAFTANDTAWFRLEIAVSTKRLTLMIGAGELEGTRASQADVLLVLTNR